MQQTEKYWNLISRIALLGIIGMATAGAILAFGPKVRQMRRYEQTRDELQSRIDLTEQAEKALREKEQRFLTDPLFVEKVAHEVGYVHTNEFIFYFSDEVIGGNGE